MSEEDVEQLKGAVKALSAEKRGVLNARCAEFKSAATEEEKTSIGKRIKDFLVENGIAAARGLTVEAIKMILMGPR